MNDDDAGASNITVVEWARQRHCLVRGHDSDSTCLMLSMALVLTFDHDINVTEQLLGECEYTVSTVHH
jgi:hypothetical protein